MNHHVHVFLDFSNHGRTPSPSTVAHYQGDHTALQAAGSETSLTELSTQSIGYKVSTCTLREVVGMVSKCKLLKL